MTLLKTLPFGKNKQFFLMDDIMKFTKKNTTCFGDSKHDNDIYKITDLNEGILIKEFGYSYQIWIDGKTRASISYDQRKGKKFKCMNE